MTFPGATVLWAAAVVLAAPCAPQTYKAVHPEIASMVDAVSPYRIGRIMQKLESFGTRDTHSPQDNPDRGIGAARRWIADELKSYSPRLEVRFDSYRVKKQGRIQRELELSNVVAVLPGTSQRERHVIMSGHYDSLVIVRKKGAQPGDPDSIDWPASSEQPFAPGVSDDASGTAAVMELARVMSQREWRKTLVFVLFAAEEQGLMGSRLFADKMQAGNAVIDAVLNSDIIGNDRAGNGESNTHTLRLFSAEPNDSPSRSLARYIRDVAMRYVPTMHVDAIFRHDRFMRGGDHSPFSRRGYAAVRFTTASENYANQHSVTDTYANASPEYTGRVSKVKLAAAACLAMAPPLPDVTRPAPPESELGGLIAAVSRGKSQYDAVLKWKLDHEEDVAGYAVVIRKTTAPDWEREIYVGKVREYTLKNFSIDDAVLGVKAISKDGFESPVAAYVATERPERKIDLAE